MVRKLGKRPFPRLSSTPKLVLLLDDTVIPPVNDTFTVYRDTKLDTVPDLVLSHIQEQLRLTLFISYSRRDHADVQALLHLISSSLARVWIDKSGLKPGEQFPEAILSAIEANEWFVLVWSRHSSRSPWVDKEWNYAHNLHQ